MADTTDHPHLDPAASDSSVEGWHEQPYEPMLPAEKKLIAGSLILGLALLALLIWASATFFPIGGSALSR